MNTLRKGAKQDITLSRQSWPRLVKAWPARGLVEKTRIFIYLTTYGMDGFVTGGAFVLRGVGCSM
jgi:hypothetical protein